MSTYDEINYESVILKEKNQIYKTGEYIILLWMIQ